MNNTYFGTWIPGHYADTRLAEVLGDPAIESIIRLGEIRALQHIISLLLPMVECSNQEFLDYAKNMTNKDLPSPRPSKKVVDEMVKDNSEWTKVSD